MKQPLDHEAILARRAALDSADNQTCENCATPVFALQTGDQAFSLDLPTLLECLRLAEKRGHVPPLGEDWWVPVTRRYGS